MKVLAEYGQEIQAETLLAQTRSAGGASPDLAKLKGARLVSSSESEENKPLKESLVKQMTGGTDTITARFLNQNQFTFTPEFKLFLMTNHRPDIRGTDQGIWDRIHLIPFNVRFWDPKKGESGAAGLKVNDKLGQQLEKELPGILRWAVEGCMKWQAGGLQVPAKVRAATDPYRAESDALGAFIEERCTLNADARCTKKELYEQYSNWADESGMNALTKPRFSKKMTERGIKDNKSGGAHHWVGVGLAYQSTMEYSA